MTWIECFCVIYMSLLFTCINGNVIPLNTFFDKLGLNLNKETDGDKEFHDKHFLEDTDIKGDTTSLHLDDGSSLLLRHYFSSGIESMQRHIQLPYIKHFARHGICRHERGRQRFYKALKSKLCHVRGQFIVELVENLCAEIAFCNNEEKDNLRPGKGKECGQNMYNWVAELFDINGDRHVDHYERYLYEYETDDGCAKCKM